MHEPSDYGMSPARTLAHLGPFARSAQHGGFWKAWSRMVFETDAVIEPRRASEMSPRDPSATHRFESTRHVPIGCVLIEPATPARAGLVVVHGTMPQGILAADAERWRDAAESGLAILLIRVRGFPGSDVHELRPATRGEPVSPVQDGGAAWIATGFEPAPPTEHAERFDWVYAHACADVAVACRALRRRLRDGAPVYLYGESLGGGLAVLAASMLAATEPVERLVLAQPSGGDWHWRLEHAPGGLAAGLAAVLARAGPLRDALLDTLQLFDAAIHARRVRGDVLCRLALRDDVVPAPCAAAVFNALDSPVGRRWRFITPYGHFDGGLANARRHALFERAARDFLDPRRQPAEAMARWEPLLTGGEREPGGRAAG